MTIEELWLGWRERRERERGGEMGVAEVQVCLCHKVTQYHLITGSIAAIHSYEFVAANGERNGDESLDTHHVYIVPAHLPLSFILAHV